MADAIWKEYELFCPVCNVYFVDPEKESNYI